MQKRSIIMGELEALGRHARNVAGIPKKRGRKKGPKGIRKELGLPT